MNITALFAITQIRTCTQSCHNVNGLRLQRGGPARIKQVNWSLNSRTMKKGTIVPKLQVTARVTDRTLRTHFVQPNPVLEIDTTVSGRALEWGR